MASGDSPASSSRSPRDPELRRELLALRDEDLRVRADLDAQGVLEGGYHPQMEAVHRKNAARLRAIVDAHGWPGRGLVGEDGAEAAWLVLQHAIGEPELQRGLLPLLEREAAAGQIPRWHAAYLADRICFFEGRPQVYGTQFTWDDEGVNVPWTLADPDSVDRRRAEVGLPPLAAGDGSPRVSPDAVRRLRAEFEAWARRTGWRR